MSENTQSQTLLYPVLEDDVIIWCAYYLRA